MTCGAIELYEILEFVDGEGVDIVVMQD